MLFAHSRGSQEKLRLKTFSQISRNDDDDDDDDKDDMDENDDESHWVILAIDQPTKMPIQGFKFVACKTDTQTYIRVNRKLQPGSVQFLAGY